MSRDLGELLKWTEAETDPATVEALIGHLAEEDGRADASDQWPTALWNLLSDAGAPLWSLPAEFGGRACPRSLLVQRYAQLATGSLTAVFILSQHDSAVRRLVEARANPTAARWLGEIGAGRAFVTVGISHLTTSRRLGTQPATAVEIDEGRYRVDGAVPWVTAAARAQLMVTGAVFADKRKLLFALPTDRPGVNIRPPFELAALQASFTTEVIFDRVEIDTADVLAGPAVDVLSQPGAVGTAGLETSALALGQSHAALKALAAMEPAQVELAEPLEVLCESWHTLWRHLVAHARGESLAIAPGQIRSGANTLALRSTQAYLTVMKGTGFLRTEPAQRWARQALFFLVWSCPTPVAHAAIRDLAGLCQV
jgi:alkylation response protein AidB-like acyl-CoA dehydrogenase